MAARAFWLALLLCAAARPSAAQIDPERRQLLQFGYNQAVDGRGPMAAYAFYYLNVPDFFASSRTLRFALGPGYADGELGFKAALGENTDLGAGLAGGAFADSHREMRGNRYRREESFRGDGAKTSLSLYHGFSVPGPAPLTGILRAEGRYAKYSREKGTEPAFAPPKAQGEAVLRAGMRYGGKEPVLRPNLAMEVSSWYEGRYRSAPSAYGFSGDRRIQPNSQLFWGRALLVYNRPASAARFLSLLSAGTSIRADSFSAYRLGGELPMAAEFPLSLPGYYHEEISARRFVLLGGSYILPLSRDKTTWTASATLSSALVDYAAGYSQRGKSHTGAGLGVAYLSRSKAWQVLAGYGYGINAARGNGNGGHSADLLMQFDFERLQAPFSHPIEPNRELQRILPRER